MPNEPLERIRDIGWELQFAGHTGAGTGTGNGCFRLRHKGVRLNIVASADEGEGWEHVSVSTTTRCPTWEEMCAVKDLFWLPEEAVVQLHPPESQYVNNHPYCLHLWRPTQQPIPLPLAIYVGVKDAGILKTNAEARALRARVLAGPSHD